MVDVLIRDVPPEDLDEIKAAARGVSLRAAANRPHHPLREADLAQALRDAEALEIALEPIPWSDVHRARALAQAALRHADAIYVAAAERHQTALVTTDARSSPSARPSGPTSPARARDLRTGQRAELQRPLD